MACQRTSHLIPPVQQSCSSQQSDHGSSAKEVQQYPNLSIVPLGSNVRSLFSLEPSTAFVNHGSFGSVPCPVLAAQAHFMARLECNPDRFLRRELKPLLSSARNELAEFVGSSPEDLVFVQNVTTGVNAVLRSLDLQDGDEVLCLNLAYPAIKKTLRFICYYTQEYVELKVVDVKLPLPSYDTLIRAVEAAITPNTRLAVFDHITSPTSLVLPVEDLIRVCHAKNVPVLIDGAHAPGQLALNLNHLGADYYVGNCYKWLYCSKGCAFLWVKRELQAATRPVVTGMAYEKGFVEEFMEQGTRDQSAFLSLPTAMAFYRALGMDRVFEYNRSLVTFATSMLVKRWGTEALVLPEHRCPFMSIVRLPIKLPASVDFSEPQEDDIADKLMSLLYDRYNVVVYIHFVQGQVYARISAQIYNVKADYQRLADAVLDLFRGHDSLCNMFMSLGLC